MNIDFELLFRAIGLMFVLEGVSWALFPEKMRSVMRQLIDQEDQQLRSLGLFGIGLGLLLIYLVAS